jgi:L-asparaginase / beta-aspartyl-peptidase
MNSMAIVVHGGCGSYNLANPVELANYNAKQAALPAIVKSGWEALLAGKSAIDVVELVINQLEAAPCFNAGIGAALGSQKQVELDASIMRGDTLDCGAVASLRAIPTTISVARAIMEHSPHVMLAGDGANAFAESLGFVRIPEEQFITDYQLYWWDKTAPENKQEGSIEPDGKIYSTVGAVVRDATGLIVAGTSTGGLTRKLPGRVGDTPIIGAGTYADSLYAGASATGIGEQIIRSMLTRSAIDEIRYNGANASAAVRSAIAGLSKFKDGAGGIILIDKNGEIGICTNETHMPHGYMHSGLAEPVVAMTCDGSDLASADRSAFKLT